MCFLMLGVWSEKLGSILEYFSLLTPFIFWFDSHSENIWLIAPWPWLRYGRRSRKEITDTYTCEIKNREGRKGPHRKGRGRKKKGGKREKRRSVFYCFASLLWSLFWKGFKVKSTVGEFQHTLGKGEGVRSQFAELLLSGSGLCALPTLSHIIGTTTLEVSLTKHLTDLETLGRLSNLSKHKMESWDSPPCLSSSFWQNTLLGEICGFWAL